MLQFSMGRDFRVLCVDDNIPLRHTVKITLELDGFEVIPAGHGTEAFTQYKAFDGGFQAIVTNGLEFVHWVRQAGYKGRIIIISGNLKLSEEDYERYDISGICHKPFERGCLVSLLIPK